ncbi:MAG: hypothetical protein O7G85_14395 [Planctomycetota bacterium]|nr:hypothetical protein [Planctomycetota bacterium]
MHDLATPMNRLRRPSLYGLALVLMFITMAALKSQNVPRYERLEIVRDGRVVVELNSDRHGGLIRLFSAQGAEMLVLRTAEDGGASIRINDREGMPSMEVRAKDRSLQITNRTQGRDQLIFDSDDDAESGEGTRNSIRLLVSRLDDMDNTLKDLQFKHQQLMSDLRSLRPGQSPEVTLDRMQRSIDDLVREQRTLDQNLRNARSGESRNQRDVDDLRRRVQRLESRPQQ